MENLNLKEAIRSCNDRNELIQLIDTINQRLERLKKEAFKDVQKKIAEMAHDLGMQPSELIEDINLKTAKKPVKTKYKSKTNPEEIWSGRGKQPQWVKDYLEADSSHTLEDLLVD